MHVCLIHPPNRIHSSYNESVVPYISQGLAWISASLKAAGHRVSIIEALVEGWDNPRSEGEFVYRGLSQDEISKRISDLAPDIVGIEIPFSTQIEPALECARTVKRFNDKIPVIVGGNHVTVMTEKTAREEAIDYAVAGEGELAIVELIRALKNNLPVTGLNGVGFVDEKGVFQFTPPLLIRDLDALPVPDYSLFPLEKYFSLVDERQMTIVTSRGCPYNCSFCSVHAVHGHKFRARNPEHVLSEIDQMVNKFRVRDLYIEDDNFSFKTERAAEICRGIIDRGYKLRIFFRNGLRADTLDRDLLQLLRQAGTRKIWLAPESGSLRIREEVIGKKLDMAAIENAIVEARRLGIDVTCFFVIGFPDETREEIAETFLLAEKLKALGAGSFCFSIATPYFGTRLYEMAKDDGCLDDVDPALLTTHSASISCKHISRNELASLQKEATSRFCTPLLPSLASRAGKAVRHPLWAIRRIFSKLCGNR